MVMMIKKKKKKKLEEKVSKILLISVCVCWFSPLFPLLLCLSFSHSLPLASLFFVGRRRFSAAICTYVYTPFHAMSSMCFGASFVLFVRSLSRSFIRIVRMVVSFVATFVYIGMYNTECVCVCVCMSGVCVLRIIIVCVFSSGKIFRFYCFIVI